VIEYTGLVADQNATRNWAKAVYLPGGQSKLHYHQEHTEVYYIVSGMDKSYKTLINNYWNVSISTTISAHLEQRNGMKI